MISYFITSPSFSLKDTLNAIKFYKPTFVCYRNKEYFNKNEILEFIHFAKNYSKVFINYNDLKDKSLIDLVDGIHLPASKLDLIKTLKNKIVIASTHNIDEVKKANSADFITFSPIFNSKGRVGLGVDILNKLPHKNIIALGGIISHKEVEKIKDTKAVGFASIRYFYKLKRD